MSLNWPKPFSLNKSSWYHTSMKNTITILYIKILNFLIYILKKTIIKQNTMAENG